MNKQKFDSCRNKWPTTSYQIQPIGGIMHNTCKAAPPKKRCKRGNWWCCYFPILHLLFGGAGVVLDVLLAGFSTLQAVNYCDKNLIFCLFWYLLRNQMAKILTNLDNNLILTINIYFVDNVLKWNKIFNLPQKKTFWSVAIASYLLCYMPVFQFKTMFLVLSFHFMSLAFLFG